MNHKKLWIVFALVFTFSFSFAFYTQQAWEDWYITYRVSKNLATGNGLVYAAGEKVQAFTSPIGTLVPAFLCVFTGNRSDELVLWLYRIIGCCLLGSSAVMLLLIARATGILLFPATVMIGLFAVNYRIIAFSTNGMESAFMMFFLVSTLYVLSVPVKRFIFMLGLSWAGLMWTRPDSFVYISGLALGYVLFRPSSPHFNSRGEMGKKFAFACIVTAAAYLPWILWTWHYYGTPIPNTISAKGLFLDRPDFNLIAQLLRFLVPSWLDLSVIHTFMPPSNWLGDWSGWPNGLIYAGAFLAFLCARYWWLPFGSPQGRAVSFALFLAHFYLTRFPTSVNNLMPWYITSVNFLSIFVLAHIIQQAEYRVKLLKDGFHRGLFLGAKSMLYVSGGIILLASLITTVAVGYEFKQEQEIINRNRKKVGMWLKDNAASPRDTVFIECLGYIGFYSQLKMYDFPGLASPEVVESRRSLQTDDYALLIWSLQPDWLVLRPVEISAIEKRIPSLLSIYYQQVRVFDVKGEVNSFSYNFVRQYLEFHQTFIVYRMKMKQNEKTEKITSRQALR